MLVAARKRSEQSCVLCDPSVARELCPSAERIGKPSASERRAQRKRGVPSPTQNEVIPHLKKLLSIAISHNTNTSD